MPARDFESRPWLVPLCNLVVFGIVFAYMGATEALLAVRAPSAEDASADALNAGAADFVASVPPEAQVSAVQSRPGRPSQAILGQWKFIAPNGDYIADFYFKSGPADRVTLTVVRKDGEIFDKEYVLQNENFKTKFIELKQYFRKDRGETKTESGIVSGFSAIRHQFSDDMMRVERENFFMGEWLSGERLEFLSDKQSP